MKRKITSLLVLLAIMTTTWQVRAAVITVTSNLDYIPDTDTPINGSLRKAMLTDAASGDTILIPGNYEIVLATYITLTSNKSLTIDGQGATVRVTNPGVSTYRIFRAIFGPSGDDYPIIIKNLNMQGGNISGYDGSDDRLGASIYGKNVALRVENCTFSKGKAYQGGAISVNQNISTGFVADSVIIDGCTFLENDATSGYAAVVISASGTTGSGLSIIRNSIFRDHQVTTGGSGVVTLGPANISNCIFRNNTSPATGESNAALIHNNASEIKVSNWGFEGNENTVTGDGAAAFFTKTATKATFTNCTFYRNKGNKGALGIKGTATALTVVNCTFAGNTGRTTTGSALYTASGATLVNNIFAYNYDTNNKDVNYGTTNIAGSNNIIAAPSGSSPANLTNPVVFAYDTNGDSTLFASYTTFEGKKIPVIDSISPTLKVIPLAENSVAQNTGIASYAGITIPTLDQRDSVRAATPCLGAYELIVREEEQEPGTPTGISLPVVSVSLIAQNPAKGYLLLNPNVQVKKLTLSSLTGSALLSESFPSTSISLSGIPAGIYIVRFETANGVIIEKLSVK